MLTAWIKKFYEHKRNRETITLTKIKTSIIRFKQILDCKTSTLVVVVVVIVIIIVVVVVVELLLVVVVVLEAVVVKGSVNTW